LNKRSQIPQFGPRLNPTRYTGVYLTRPHKLVLIFSFRAGTTVLSTPRNFSSLISVSSLPLYPVSSTLLNTNNRSTNFTHCDTVSLQYEPRSTLGRPPTPRGYHASVLADSRLFVFGGFNGHDVFDDVHILDLAAAAYLPQVTSFSIDAQ
jgi:hypothetical protein